MARPPLLTQAAAPAGKADASISRLARFGQPLELATFRNIEQFDPAVYAKLAPDQFASKREHRTAR
jgi:hypothetical protein